MISKKDHNYIINLIKDEIKFNKKDKYYKLSEYQKGFIDGLLEAEIIFKKFQIEGYSKNGKIYLERCPKCKKENYAMMVSSGICCWCGYKAKEKDRTDIKENK